MKPIFTDGEDSLPQWITLLYEKVDGDSMVYLRNQDREYQDIMKKKNLLRSQYPCIDRLMEEPEAMEISSEEHKKSFWNIWLYGTKWSAGNGSCITGAVMCIAMII